MVCCGKNGRKFLIDKLCILNFSYFYPQLNAPLKFHFIFFAFKINSIAVWYEIKITTEVGKRRI